MAEMNDMTMVYILIKYVVLFFVLNT
jgi:hypothetical protein